VAYFLFLVTYERNLKHYPVYRPLNIGFNLSEGILNETADSMFSLFITTSVNGNYPCVTGIAVNGR